MNELTIIFIVAFIVEAVWQAIKPLWPARLRMLEKERGVPVDAIGCLLISVLLCFGANVDLLNLVGVPMSIPYVGIILTALLIHRGSNFLHDVIAGINGIVQNNKPITYIDAGMGEED